MKDDRKTSKSIEKISLLFILRNFFPSLFFGWTCWEAPVIEKKKKSWGHAAELRGQAILNKRSRHLYGGRIIYQKLHRKDILLSLCIITKMELPHYFFAASYWCWGVFKQVLLLLLHIHAYILLWCLLCVVFNVQLVPTT